MASEGLKALMLVPTLRSKGVVFSDGGPEIPDHLDGVEGMSVVRRQREDRDAIPGRRPGLPLPPSIRAWLADLWGRLDNDGATIQDDFTERFKGIFKQWSDEVLCPMDIGG